MCSLLSLFYFRNSRVQHTRWTVDTDFMSVSMSTRVDTGTPTQSDESVLHRI
ncbi:hypothetical protein Scep_021911 [Stephania cephalantha]|uniref:Uncharacterized protein n=1 Tax=Stephania cephalantha TaxID=152367 RepID=A0AAP0F706_9MAGN